MDKIKTSKKLPKMYRAGLYLCSIIICLFFIATPPSFASKNGSYYFEDIGKKDGLPDMTVFQISQDHHGFIWFGTRNGVAKYDGTRITIYQHAPNDQNSLSHNDAGGVIEDDNHNIWVRTWGGGLNRIDKKTGRITVFKNSPDNSYSLSGNRVQLLYKENNGTIWAGTFKAGLNRYEKDKNVFTRFSADGQPGSLNNNRIWSMAETDKKSLWVGTDNGLHLFNPEEQSFKTYYFRDKPETVHAKNQIRALFKKNRDALWVGTDKGLKLFNTKTGRYTQPGISDILPDSVKSGIINCIFQNKAGILWIGTQNDGLTRIEPGNRKTVTFRHDPLEKGTISHNDIRCITEDSSGVIWIGTRGGGANRLSTVFSQFDIHTGVKNSSNCGKAHESIHAMEKDNNGQLIIGSWYNGLTTINKNGDCRQFSGVAQSTGKDINTLLKLHDGRILAGTWYKGLVIFSSLTDTFRAWHSLPALDKSLSKSVITALAQDKDKALWIGTRDHGLFKGNPITGKIQKIKSDNQLGIIKVLLPTQSTRLWIGTTNGLYGINAADEPVKPFRAIVPIKENLTNSLITSLCAGQNESLWVGTYQGLNLINLQNGTIRRYLSADGLAGEQIKSIICDAGGAAWITTESGISLIKPYTNQILNYYIPINFNEGVFHKSDTGDVSFGGENGYLSFNPVDITVPDKKPEIAITGFSVLDTKLVQGQMLNGRIPMPKPASDTDRLILSHNENYFSISFALMDFNNPQKNRLKFMLEGFDNRWQETSPGMSFAKYAGVPPGHYRFIIKGTNSIGIATDKEPCIDLIITAPIWSRWYIKAGISGFIVFFFILGVYIRFSRIRYMNEKLQYLVDKRTKELLEQKNKLEELSITDPLTGALNRRGFSDRFNDELSRNKRNQTPMTIVLSDIDDFKTINDTHGHDCGDLVLTKVVSLIRTMARAQDIIGRWGGEEFIMLLPETPVEGAVIFTERLREAIATQLIDWNGKSLYVSMTFGIRGCTDTSSMESIVSNADKALYTGKNKGKNCVVVYDSLTNQQID